MEEMMEIHHHDHEHDKVFKKTGDVIDMNSKNLFSLEE
jgi:hypothetical protein